MDYVAHRVANVVAGNRGGAAALEATLLGPELRFEQDTCVAIAGADLGATLNGARMPLVAPVQCPKASVLRFDGRRSGTRAYIAFQGGLASDPVLGSQATHIVSSLGGRSLKAGDRLPLGEAPAVDVPASRIEHLRARSMPTGGARLRVLPGPQAESFDQTALDHLQRARFTISPRSDRMGYRLAGGRLAPSVRGEMISDVTITGGLQVPPSGEPILLMVDR
jgi:antagonist of KipI